jgi:TRAP-type C4-dicarboxylate transport system permease small subunit
VSRLEKSLEAISRALLAGAGALVLAMTALVVLAAFMRYFVGSPFAFTEELVALMFLAMVFLTVPISTVRREHIVVTVCVERAGPKAQSVLGVLAAAVMLAFSIWFAVETYASAAFSKKIGARTDHFQLLLWPWMGVIVAVMSLVALITLIQLWRAVLHLRGRTSHVTQRQAGDGL